MSPSPLSRPNTATLSALTTSLEGGPTEFIEIYVAGTPESVAVIQYGAEYTLRQLRGLVKAQVDKALLPPRWGFAYNDGVKVRLRPPSAL